MGNEHFSLSLNAFSVLKASFASNHAEISDLVEDAEFDELHSQEIIQRSQQALLSPIARLDQELSWLPELSNTQINEIGSLLEEGRITDLREAIAFLPDLSKANVLAHLCGTNSADETLLQDLLRSWDDVDQLSLLQFLNTQRQAAGFPQVERSQLAASINVLESTHARSAALSVWRLAEPGKVMESLVEAELKKGRVSRILAEFVREYDILSEPHLARISEAIDQQIELASQPTQQLEAVTSEIAELLRQWDDVNQPVQFFGRLKAMKKVGPSKSTKDFDHYASSSRTKEASFVTQSGCLKRCCTRFQSWNQLLRCSRVMWRRWKTSMNSKSSFQCWSRSLPPVRPPNHKFRS